MRNEDFYMTISLYENAYAKTNTATSYADIYECITKNVTLRENVEQLRGILQTQGKAEYSKLKCGLPAITTSGTFTNNHKTDCLAEYNDCVQVDIDGIKNADELKTRIVQDQHVLMSFISPSGNGLKIIVPIDGYEYDNLTAYHRHNLKAVCDYYEAKYAVKTDYEATKDFTRLLFLSHDANAYYNPNATKFKIENKYVAPVPAAPVATIIDTPAATITATKPKNKKPDSDEFACDTWTLGQAEWHLRAIKSDDYNVWRNVGFALYRHFHGSNDAFKLFVEWSKKSPNFTSAEDCQKTIWNCGSSADGGITIRTIAAYHNDSCQPFYKQMYDDLESRKGEIYTLAVSYKDSQYGIKRRDGYKKVGVPEAVKYVNEYFLKASVTPNVSLVNRIVENLYLISDAYSHISCYDAGVHDFNGNKILVEHSPKVIIPVKGEWSNIRKTLELTLPQQDREWLYSRLALDIKAFRDKNFTLKGQVMLFVGKVNTAKTLLQKWICKLYSGTFGDVTKYISGESRFNKDMLRSPYWVIDDKFNKPTGVAVSVFRERVAEFLKVATVAGSIEFEGKHMDALNMERIFRRSVLTLNDDSVVLKQLPDSDAGIADKFSLLHFKYDFTDEKQVPDETFESELPAFAYFLMYEWQKPDWIKNSGRFGIKEFHNIIIGNSILESSDLYELRSNLETIMVIGRMPEMIGTSKDIFGQCHSIIDRENLRSRLSKGVFVRLNETNFGHWLSRLKRAYPNEYEVKGRSGYNLWTIHAEMPPDRLAVIDAGGVVKDFTEE
jgi:hypothetical protein